MKVKYLLAFAFLAGCASVDQSPSALSADTNARLCITKSSWNERFPHCLKSAEMGNIHAMSIVSSLYAEGNGTPRDDLKSVFWAQKAADANSTDIASAGGMMQLGDMYYQGRGGLEKSTEKAVYWYEQAKKRGFYLAQYKYAGLLLDIGNLSDCPKILESFEQSALQGFGPASTNLGVLYVKGVCTERNKAKAYGWFRLGYYQGDDVKALTYLNKLAGGEMTPEELQQGHQFFDQLMQKKPISPAMIALTKDFVR
jgi:TPR repeat protein